MNEQNRKPEFRRNRLLEEWSAGRSTLNGWLAIPNGSSAEVMAHAGWDSLTLDMQHGLIDYQSALVMLTAISSTPTVPIVRVPWLDEGWIMKALDAGAYGVICPMINTREEAERFARACKYPPLGVRSYGPVRAGLYSRADYLVNADNETLAFAMIETRQAVSNLEDILDVPGIQAIYIGPADLSVSFGYAPSLDQKTPEVKEVIEHIITTARNRGKWVGIHNATVGNALEMIKLGANMVTVGSDMRLMAAGAHKVVNDFRSSED